MIYLIPIAALAFMVLIHELGHFIVARWAGVRVEVFSVGFGRSLWQAQKGDTLIKIGWIPLGGYVKLLSLDELPPESPLAPQAMENKPKWKQILIMLGGPVANFVLAWIVFCGLWMWPQTTLGPVLDAPLEGSFFQGQIQAGDRILRVQNQAPQTFAQAQSLLSEARDESEPISLTLERQGKEVFLDRLSLPPQSTKLGLRPLVVLPPVVGMVLPKSPASKAGLQPGDRLLKAAGKPLTRFSDLTSHVKNNQPLSLLVDRGGEMLNLTATPTIRAESQKPTIGVIAAMPKPDGKNWVRFGLSPWDAAWAGWMQLWRSGRFILDALGGIFTGKTPLSAISSPVGVVNYGASALSTSMLSFLSLLGFLSLQLGLINLIPIPITDGGRISMLLIEAAIGRPLSEQTRAWLMNIGIALLVGLLSVGLYNDLL